jgi:hypothetical protein
MKNNSERTLMDESAPVRVEPSLRRNEARIMWGVVLGFLLLCIALVP